jgi:hypothetical protein
VVIGDHGSAAVYAAASGVPVLRAPTVAGYVSAHSAVERLAEIAPAVNDSQPLTRQLDDAVAAFRDQSWTAITARVCAEPYRAASLLRTQMYQLLRLTEPAMPAETAPVPAARLHGE